ncbi:MAG: hypothetical protein J2P18_06985 [Nocardia sp.]|nr:hypothetical protein [Nocardia sp.]
MGTGGTNSAHAVIAAAAGRYGTEIDAGLRLREARAVSIISVGISDLVRPNSFGTTRGGPADIHRTPVGLEPSTPNIRTRIFTTI